MEPFGEGRGDPSRSQGSAVPFTLPCIIDSTDATERNSSRPVTSIVQKGAVQLAEPWLFSTPPQHTSATTQNQQFPQNSSESLNALISSANNLSLFLPNPVNAALPESPSYPVPSAPSVGSDPTLSPTARLEENDGPLPLNRSATLQAANASPARPCSGSSIGSDSVLSPTEAAVPGTWTHVLVVFDKLFCVCFVPLSLRPMRVGELVLCEFGTSDNIATVVADVSSLVGGAMADKEATEWMFGFNSPTAPASGATYRNSRLLYQEKLASGLASDHLLCRLPSLVRRGTNRDKKRLYFSKLRSNDALAVAQHELLGQPITAQAAEYQVNFACAIIYLAGERRQCVLPDSQFRHMGETLLEKLRCETVQFRFWAERSHVELDLTRAILGSQYSEMLYGKVLEYLRSQSSRSSQRATAQANAVRQQVMAAAPQQQPQQRPPPPPPPPQQQQKQSVGESTDAMSRAPSYPDSQSWSHSATTVSAMTSVPTVTFLQQTSAPQQHSLSYAVAPSFYVAQQAASPTGMQSLSSTPSVSIMSPSSYQAFHHVSATPVTYITQHANSAYYENQQQHQQQQQQQPTLTLSHNPVPGSPVYYVVPSSAAMQWDRASIPVQQGSAQQQHYLQQIPSSQLPVQAHTTPTLFHAAGATVRQQSLQTSTQYVQTPMVNQQGYHTVSCPVVFSPNATSYQQF
jgi:hypothetical protein